MLSAAGVDAIEPIKVFSTLAYVRPVFMFCGVKFPEYISSFAAIAGVLHPQILLAYSAAVSSRLVWQTIAGITADRATVLASTAAWPIAMCLRQWAANGCSPRKLSSLAFHPICGATETHPLLEGRADVGDRHPHRQFMLDRFGQPCRDVGDDGRRVTGFEERSNAFGWTEP